MSDLEKGFEEAFVEKLNRAIDDAWQIGVARTLDKNPFFLEFELSELRANLIQMYRDKSKPKYEFGMDWAKGESQTVVHQVASPDWVHHDSTTSGRTVAEDMEIATRYYDQGKECE